MRTSPYTPGINPAPSPGVRATQPSAKSVSESNYAQLVKSGASNPGFGAAKRKDWALAVVLTIFFPAGVAYVLIRVIYCKCTGKPVTVFWPCMRSALTPAAPAQTQSSQGGESQNPPAPEIAPPPQSSPSLSKPLSPTSSGKLAHGAEPEATPNSKPGPEPEPAAQQDQVSTANQNSQTGPFARPRPKISLTPFDEKVLPHTSAQIPQPEPSLDPDPIPQSKPQPDPSAEPRPTPCLNPVSERNRTPQPDPSVEPGPSTRPAPTPEDVKKACMALVTSLPQGGGGKGMFAKLGKPCDSAAVKSALRILASPATEIPPLITGVPSVACWRKEFLMCVLRSDDPELRDLGYGYVRKCKQGVRFWFEGRDGMNFARTLKDPQRSELRQFLLENSGFVKSMFAHDLEYAVDLFSAVDGLRDALMGDDFDNLSHAVQFITSEVAAGLLKKPDHGELNQCFEGILQIPQARQKILEILETSLHPQSAPMAHAQSALLYLGRGAFPKFCREDPKAFVRFVAFSPNSFVREEGMKIALQEGLDISQHIRENTPLFVEQVLAMGKPFTGDGYRSLAQHNLGSVLLEHASDEFVKLVLKSPNKSIAAAGLNFITQSGLSLDLVRLHGQEIIQHILVPARPSLPESLLCAFLQQNEVRLTLQDQYSASFSELSNTLLSGNPRRTQLHALVSLANAFGKSDIAEKARTELQKFPPVCLGPPFPKAGIEEAKILIPAERTPADDFGVYQMVGQSLFEYVQSPLFILRQDIKSSQAYIDTGEACPQEGAHLQLLSEEFQKASQDMTQASLTRSGFDICRFGADILGAQSRETRQTGYESLKKKFPDTATLKAELGPILSQFCPFLPLSVPLFNVIDDASMLGLMPYSSVQQCVDVCDDFLKFCKADDISDAMMRAPVKEMNGVPFAMLLLTSPDANQRMTGYDFIRNENIDLTAPENFQFFVHMVLNSDNAGIRKAGIDFLKTQGIEYVEINGVIHKFESY